MPAIIPRASWGARAPRSRATVNWTQRTEFVVHHSEGPATQTPKAIQNFHMDSRGWADLGYNFLISADGRIYEGRGWLVVGAHAPNHNTSGIGVCLIGSYTKTLPTAAALESLQWLYAEANRRKGSALRIRRHRDVTSTDCPGGALASWVSANLGKTSSTPTGEGDMVGLKQGDSGERVKFLQELLRAGGHDLGPAGIDGEYGPATSRAVLAARKAEGSKQDFGDRITGAAAKQILSQFIKSHL
ncbi:peptidoglycan recognition protein family protein [Marinitenerispora sediminis]|uniref:MarR family transcriptional regulator n=1 Tax=Marinitenerispora sediminis TaxID=1931232 RepID=A0A368T715_9ACTN|nr:N-acetylmuramoyl-L-alanine amidase [Marinitenerispora sediminis]RCV53462.1 MarR family transcriptional regulator [Marinitenerispora sediminis]RCV59290.1 MarR family transcriptional regulator [Marinitenerispora sediminis]